MSVNLVSVRQVKQSKEYQKISFETRKELIKLVEQKKLSIKKASQKVNVNYSTGKLIMKKYKNQGRITVFSYEKVNSSVLSKSEQISIEKLDQGSPRLIQKKLTSIEQNQGQNLSSWYWVSPNNGFLSQENHSQHQNQTISSIYNLANTGFYCWNFW